MVDSLLQLPKNALAGCFLPTECLAKPTKRSPSCAASKPSSAQDPATRIRKHLYVANAKPMAKPHIDAYMEQLIRIKGRVHGLVDQEWDDLQKCLNRDPASFQTLIARSDEELIYALRSAREETLDGAHGLSRHGPDVTDAKLERRVTQGYAPDDKVSPASPSTKFRSYKDFFETREAAKLEISAGEGFPNTNVDFSSAPGINGNGPDTVYEIVLEHSTRPNMAEGFEGVGSTYTATIPHLVKPGHTNVNIYHSARPIGNGINRTKTAIKGGSQGPCPNWKVTQHIPWGIAILIGSRCRYNVSANHTNLKSKMIQPLELIIPKALIRMYFGRSYKSMVYRYDNNSSDKWTEKKITMLLKEISTFRSTFKDTVILAFGLAYLLHHPELPLNPFNGSESDWEEENLLSAMKYMLFYIRQKKNLNENPLEVKVILLELDENEWRANIKPGILNMLKEQGIEP